MNVVNIERSRSGEADPSCSCRNRAGSILDGAVIAWFSCRTVEGLQEDHAVAALLDYATPLTRSSAVHHSGGRTPLRSSAGAAEESSTDHVVFARRTISAMTWHTCGSDPASQAMIRLSYSP